MLYTILYGAYLVCTSFCRLNLRQERATLGALFLNMWLLETIGIQPFWTNGHYCYCGLVYRLHM